MSTEPLLIVNPRSGGGKTGKVFASMQSVIEARLGTVKVAFTEQPGHGIELARAGAVSGHPLIISVGGDGTFNEVVNGVMQSGRATQVGIIGQGTGGDFSRTLGVEHRLDKYLDALASGRERKLDVGFLRYRDGDATRERYFVNILSAGMGGLVDRYVANASRALGGTAAYFGASLKALVACREGKLLITVSSNGQSRQVKIASYMLAICNGRFFGSGMNVAPMAKIDDGRLEVVSIGATSKLAFALSSGSIYSGAHIGKPGVEHFPCDKIKIDLENEDARDVFLLDCDGEAIGGLPIEVELRKGAVVLRG